MHETACSEQQLRIFVADGVDLCEILLIMRCLVDESTAAEYLDVVHQTLQEGVVDPALDVCVVAYAAVGPYDFRECILEPFREAERLCSELYDMHEVAELRCAVVEPLCAEAELRIYSLDMVTDLLESLSLVTAGVYVLDREFS